MLDNYFITSLCSYFIYYSISYLLYRKKYIEKYNWNVITYIMSTINSIICIKMSLSEILFNPNVGDFYEMSENGSKGLYQLSSYLFIDGLFGLYFFKFEIKDMMTFIHHIIGGLGVFLIAYHRKAFGIGCYFAMTELSTPLLNISWYFYVNNIKGKFVDTTFLTAYILFILSRIVTFPFLLMYIGYNEHNINFLTLFEKSYVYYGSYILISLNLIWFIRFSRKIFKF